MQHTRGQKLRYLSPPLEFLVRFTRVSLLVLVILSLLFTKTIELNLTGGLVSLGLVSVAILASLFPTVRDLDRSLFAKIRRRLYIQLLAAYSCTHRTIARSLIGHLIYVPFRYTRYTHEGQERVIERISLALRERPERRPIFYVEGGSGTGKTTTVLFLLHALMQQGLIGDNSDNVYYFDFGQSLDQQRGFIQTYPNLRMENSLLVVDNFHRIHSRYLRAFTRYVVYCHAGCLEKCLVILSQPLSQLAVTPEVDIALLSAVKRAGNHFVLSRPPGVETQPETARGGRAPTLPDGCPMTLPALLALHYSRLAEHLAGRYGSALRKIVNLESVLETGAPLSRDDRDLVQTLGLVTGLSIHRGMFSTSEFRQASSSLGNGNWLSRYMTYKRLHRQLTRLAKSGFVLQTLLDRGVYVFHEVLAAYYKDRFCSFPVFGASFTTSVHVMLSDVETGNSLLAWLYCVELDEAEKSHTLFEKALLTGNFSSMLHTLERNREGNLPGTIYEYEFGILCEKVGDLDNARRQLKRVLQLASGTTLAHRIMMEFIEADHGPESAAELMKIIERTDSSLLKLAARYWLLHIRMHDGIFDLYEMLKVATEVQQSAETIVEDSPYFFAHFVRRLYFDLFRCFYLRGSGDASMFMRLKTHGLREIVGAKHTAYDAYVHKFILGHYIHYEYLFSIGVLGRQPKDFDREILDLPDEKLRDVDRVIELALGHYAHAAEEFQIFGDKTVRYLLGRIVELEMAHSSSDLRAVQTKLNEYSDFVERTGFSDMLGCSHMYQFKFHCLMGMNSLHQVVPDGIRKNIFADYALSMRVAQSAVEAALDVHRRLGNKYGELRARLLSELFRFFLPPHDKSRLVERLKYLRTECDRFDYERESKLIAYVLDRDGMSPMDFLNIVRFYPIVHQ